MSVEKRGGGWVCKDFFFFFRYGEAGHISDTHRRHTLAKMKHAFDFVSSFNPFIDIDIQLTLNAILAETRSSGFVRFRPRARVLTLYSGLVRTATR